MFLLTPAALDAIAGMLADVGRSWVDPPVVPPVVPPAVARKLCRYCNLSFDKKDITREHLLPKSAGGTQTIDACACCNRARGNRSTYPPFVEFICNNPDVWADAVGACSDRAKLAAWMRGQFAASTAGKRK